MLTYPAPERNKDPILGVLARVLPTSGRILEIASGTGQHVVHFARALPRLLWQPSDYEAPHREAIAQRIAAAATTNIQAPLELDALVRPWRVGEVDGVVCINMIHIAPWPAGVALIEESARLLPEGGVLFLYGPYRRGTVPTAPSNEAFDASLRERNPEWGLRQLETVTDLCALNGLELQEIVEMPANNLSVVFRRRAVASGR